MFTRNYTNGMMDEKFNLLINDAKDQDMLYAMKNINGEDFRKYKDAIKFGRDGEPILRKYYPDQPKEKLIKMFLPIAENYRPGTIAQLVNFSEAERKEKAYKAALLTKSHVAKLAENGAGQAQEALGLNSGVQTQPAQDNSGESIINKTPAKKTNPLDLYWEYSQITGKMTRVNSQTGQREHIATGYAGKGPGINCPDMEKVKNIGPIPQGAYDIGPQRHSKKTGVAVIDLTPWPDNKMYGRSGFQIHGDTIAGNQSASEGCIVIDRNTRDRIANSNNGILYVVP